MDALTVHDNLFLLLPERMLLIQIVGHLDRLLLRTHAAAEDQRCILIRARGAGPGLVGLFLFLSEVSCVTHTHTHTHTSTNSHTQQTVSTRLPQARIIRVTHPYAH